MIIHHTLLYTFLIKLVVPSSFMMNYEDGKTIRIWYDMCMIVPLRRCVFLLEWKGIGELLAAGIQPYTTALGKVVHVVHPRITKSYSIVGRSVLLIGRDS